MNASPSLDFDVMRATDKFAGPFTPPGFYYKTFIRPRRFWPLYEKVLRHAAGLGRVRKSQPDREWRTEYRRRHADLLVVGGGAAGLCAATAAADLGADVVLCDEGPEPGGRLLAEGGQAHARELTARAQEAGVEVLANAPHWAPSMGSCRCGMATPFTRYVPGGCSTPRGVEQPAAFPGNDLPGVMLSGGSPAGRSYAVKARRPCGGRHCLRSRPGRRSAPWWNTASTSCRWPTCARACRRRRSGPRATRHPHQERLGRCSRRAQWPRQPGCPGSAGADGERKSTATSWFSPAAARPPLSLLAQSGARTAYDHRARRVRVSHIRKASTAAGEVCGPVSLEDAQLSGVVPARSRTTASASATAARSPRCRRGAGASKPPGTSLRTLRFRRPSTARPRASASPACART